MKKAIEYLKKDRLCNDTFEEKLRKVGLDIDYGTYAFWDMQPYVSIGRKKVWLVCEKTESNNTYLARRYQNNVINDIIETITEENERAEKADARVDDFFQKLSN